MEHSLPFFLSDRPVDNKNIKLILAYDGTKYHGWQRQKKDTTIQGIIEDMIQKMTGEQVKLISSGRTDAGVHAVNQVCNFITGSNLDPETIKKGLNSLLPDDILIKKAACMPLEFHSRHCAKSKTYNYRILNSKAPDIFRRNYLWHIRVPLKKNKMAKCLPIILGRHDFTSFKSSGSGNTDPVRSVIRAEFHNLEDGLFSFHIEANGFLRHMVRNIVGTLVEVGLGKMDVNRFKEVFDSKNRCLAGKMAPPQGLFLLNVQY